MKRNYQKELDKQLERITNGQEGENPAPKLLLHSCCAPCSSYVLEYLSQYFQITVFYYNPNIYPEEEYFKRVEEQKGFIRRFQQNRGQGWEGEVSPGQPEPSGIYHKAGCYGGSYGKGEASPSQPGLSGFYHISFLEGSYDKAKFYQMAKGMESIPEGGERCFRCYRLRLQETAWYAKELGMDYFTTTLTVSPLKNAEKLNGIGEELAQEYGVPYLTSDFKKREGYKRSIELSKEYGMYRQDYCGCVFSMQERQQRLAQVSAGARGSGTTSKKQLIL